MNTNISKTTLYFDNDLYIQVKKAAMDQHKSTTQFIAEVLQNALLTPQKTGKYKSKLPKAVNLGKIKGMLSREEIYDFI